MRVRRLAIAWLQQEDWPAWLATDPGFQPDFEHWRRRVETAFTRLKAAGVNVVKVEIDPDEFLEWSRAAGRGVDTHARAAFAAFKGMQQDNREGKH